MSKSGLEVVVVDVGDAQSVRLGRAWRATTQVGPYSHATATMMDNTHCNVHWRLHEHRCVRHSVHYWNEFQTVIYSGSRP